MNTSQQFDENTTDPRELEAMFEQMEKGEVALPSDESEDKEQVEAVVDDPKSTGQEKEPDGVATRDGKHIIPYSVLQADRERAKRAEDALAEMQRKVAELEAQSVSGVKQVDAAEPQQTDDLTADELENLKEDFPSVYKAMMKATAKAEQLEARLNPIQENFNKTAQDQQRSMEELVQDAIDATPKLTFIKSNDPTAFELAKQFDNTLKESAAWKGKPLADRFAKVIEMVESANGAINLPNENNSQKTASQLKAEAQAIASQQARANKTSVPTSLSDFPAGQSVAGDERENAQNMTALQLATKFQSMTPDQQEAYLTKLSS